MSGRLRPRGLVESLVVVADGSYRRTYVLSPVMVS